MNPHFDPHLDHQARILWFWMFWGRGCNKGGQGLLQGGVYKAGVGAKGGEWGASKAVWGLPKHKRGGLGVTRAGADGGWIATNIMLSCASCLLILVARPQIPNSGD